ncbi:MAG: pyridoxal-dependent decarboxylase, partial [Thermoanaerobaculia bacterium]|nr:pyridoxal-dependent decarboxylase [Thermoanaerobaculia bacterium]
LSAGLGVQGMLWSTSPACTELETHVLDWLAEMLDLPLSFRSTSTGGGVIQDTASSASLCALLAARERATEGRANEKGTPDDLTVYASDQTHSSIEKAVRIAGVGSDRLRLVATDENRAMRADALEEAIRRDLDDGLRPCLVAATVGTTSTNAMDPLHEIGPVCTEHGIWLHVDAAMSGTAALCPEHRWIHRGLERADSYCMNPHKWMLTNFDCDAFWVADREALISALSILPEYLRNRASESGRVIDYRDWQIPLGRRFRALKLWFVIRWFGVEGLRSMVRDHVQLAQELAQRVRDTETLELAAPVPLNLLCFRHRDGEEATQRILDRVNASGDAYLTHTRLDGDLVVRVCVGQEKTRRTHVERLWELILSV